MAEASVSNTSVAYVSIRQHTSVYVSIKQAFLTMQINGGGVCLEYLSRIRQHTSHPLPLPLVLDSGRGGERMREGVVGTGEGAGRRVVCACMRLVIQGHSRQLNQQTTKSWFS